MKIEYFGHSCFKVSSGGFSVVIDPYAQDSVPGLPPLRLTANKVLCSHEHSDHNGRGAVRIVKNDTCGFRFSTVKSWHDDVKGAKRGKNQIYILEAEGLRIAHLGDLGCVPDDGQVDAIGKLDAVMIPVGGYYTIDAACAVETLKRLGSPRVVIPMHYRTPSAGYGVLAELDGFLELMSDRKVVRTDGELELDAETPECIAIL